MGRELEYILVGDHLGQVKKVLFPSGEVSLLGGGCLPSSSNPVMSIESIPGLETKQVIANREGQINIYDCIRDTIKELTTTGDANLNKAIPISEEVIALVYDKRITVDGQETVIKQKRGEIKCAAVNRDNIAYAGIDIPLRIIDSTNMKSLFEGSQPEKDWLGISPEVYVSDIAYVGETRVATCSRSDSVIRIFDTRGRTKPIITIDFNDTAFNEHAEACRFHSIASSGRDGHTVVAGTNVGQLFAVDLRFNVKPIPEKKRLRPKTHKILGSFKGARGATIKDIKLVPAVVPKHAGRYEDDTVDGYRVVSCCLDRYLRIYNFSKNNRSLLKHVYMTTKPQCCSPVLSG